MEHFPNIYAILSPSAPFLCPLLRGRKRWSSWLPFKRECTITNACFRQPEWEFDGAKGWRKRLCRRTKTRKGCRKRLRRWTKTRNDCRRGARRQTNTRNVCRRIVRRRTKRLIAGSRRAHRAYWARRTGVGFHLFYIVLAYQYDFL